MFFHKKFSGIIDTDLSYKLFYILLTLLLLYIRKSDSLLNPQFWAEDGTIFFKQQYEYGFSVVFWPYAGYLHFIPRIIAVVGSFFPYCLIPAIYNYLSLLITLGIMISFFSKRLVFKNKGMLILSIVMVPHFSNEIFLNVTNIQWIVFVLLLVTILKDEPNKIFGNIYFQKVGDLLILVIGGLTGPFLPLMIPLVFYKWYISKTKFNKLLLLIALIISIIQFINILNGLSITRLSSGIPELRLIFDFVGYRLFGDLVFGFHSIYTPVHSIYNVNVFLLLLMYILLISVIVLYSRKDIRLKYFLYIHLIFVITALIKFYSEPNLFAYHFSAERYFYIPFLMIIWALICIYEKENKNWKRIIGFILILITASSLGSSFRSSFIDYNWNYYCKSIGSEKICIPINPPDWQIALDK